MRGNRRSVLQLAIDVASMAARLEMAKVGVVGEARECMDKAQKLVDKLFDFFV